MSRFCTVTGFSVAIIYGLNTIGKAVQNDFRNRLSNFSFPPSTFSGSGYKIKIMERQRRREQQA